MKLRISHDMKIRKFTVENYRSITKASALPVHDLSILIGPNNEGKSNLLRALVITMYTIQDFFSMGQHRAVRSRSFSRRRDEGALEYRFERDFPLVLPKNSKSHSLFKIEFELTPAEKIKIGKIVGKKFTTNLLISIQHFKNSVTFGVFDTKTKINYDKHERKIFKYISENFEVSYIAAIRDSERTVSIVEDMISKELSILKKDKKYQTLLSKLEKLQKPVLDRLSISLTKGVSNFLPDVKSIQLDSKERIQRFSSLSPKVIVDDGIKTSLEQKGDGIKSLMAISIIQHLTKQRAAKKNIFLAIEEPESHLHPNAIHKLRDVLDDISKQYQVIISTHSPLLVNRSDVSRNLIVNKSQVTAAHDISNIRDILGVKIADNLRTANMLILVEGEEDRQVIKKCLEELSPNIKKALEQGIFSFDVLGGGSNLSHKTSMWQNSLCDVCAFLDNDAESQKAFDIAQKNSLLDSKEVFFALVNGYKESELEDMIDLSSYQNKILDKYGVDLSKTREFRNNKQKWSVRVKKAFQGNSKRWNNKTELDIKHMVALTIIDLGIKSLNKHHKKPIIHLQKFLEEYLKTNKKSMM